MRSLASAVLVRITWVLTVLALLAFSTSAGLFDLSRPGQAATAALSSPAGQRLATDFIADQLLVAVPGLSEKTAHDLAAKVAADPDTLEALKQANLKSASAPQDRAALLDVVASQLEESNPKVAAATERHADRARAAAASGPADPDAEALAELPSPVGNLLDLLQEFTGEATNVSAVMAGLKERLANAARILAALAVLTALGALLVAPSRAKVVRSFGWMFISISLIPAAVGWLLPDLVLSGMSSDWAQALAVGLRVGGGRLIGLFVGLLCVGVALLVLGLLGPRLGALLTPARAPGGRGQRPAAPSGPSSPYDRSQQAARRQPVPGQYVPEDLANTRPMGTVQDGDPRYAPPPSGYPYPQSYPPAQQPPGSPGGRYPDQGPYDDPPAGSRR